jgi:NADH dehydrogenase [ubiquinone] 1 alpha subcomplex assembly factor 5
LTGKCASCVLESVALSRLQRPTGEREKERATAFLFPPRDRPRPFNTRSPHIHTAPPPPSSRTKAAQRDRAAWLARHDPLSRDDPLTAEVASRLATRLDECGGRGPFGRALVLGGGVGTGALVARLAGRRGGVEHVTVIEASLAQCDRLGRRASDAASDADTHARHPWPELTIVHADEEDAAGPAAAALAPGSDYDVALACLGLHWVNDLPGLLTRVRAALAPDRPFLGVMWGGDTLHELRGALTLAEMRAGGASPRVSPMVRVRDAGSLLVRAGFALPAVDADELRVVFSGPAALVDHLRAVGETNAALARRHALLPRAVVPDALETYVTRFGRDAAAEAGQAAAERGEGGEGGVGPVPGSTPAACEAAATAARAAGLAVSTGEGGCLACLADIDTIQVRAMERCVGARDRVRPASGPSDLVAEQVSSQ